MGLYTERTGHWMRALGEHWSDLGLEFYLFEFKCQHMGYRYTIGNLV